MSNTLRAVLKALHILARACAETGWVTPFGPFYWPPRTDHRGR